MSTRSLIAYQSEAGFVESAYCHFDGYISGVGSMLDKNYQDEKKIRELIQRGDFSSLCPNIGEIKFYEPLHKVVVNCHNSEWGFVDSAEPLYHEYLYLFKEGYWYVSESKSLEVKDGFEERVYYYSKFEPLSKALFKLGEVA